MEFGLGRRVLLILKVDDVQNVSPWTFIAVDALRLAIAGASVDGWQAVRIYLLQQAFRLALTSYVNLGSRVRTPLRQDLVVVKVFEEHGRVNHCNGVNELWEAFGQLLADLLPDHIQLAVRDLLKSCTFQVDYDSDLVDVELHLRLYIVELLPPGVL